MHRNLLLIAASLLGLLFFSSAVAVTAHATGWVGNDNGEFGTNGVTPAQVYTDNTLGSQMSWSALYGEMSLQYNPDTYTSYLYQYLAEWFQTVIGSDENSCVLYTIQVYNVLTGVPIWSTFYPTTGCITISGGVFGSGADWYISEDVNTWIYEVDFHVIGSSNSLYYSLYPPYPYWIWLKSNICWCGSNLDTATFTSAGGQDTYFSNVNLYAIGPPTWVATAENSNVEFGCFHNSGHSTIWQFFRLSSHC